MKRAFAPLLVLPLVVFIVVFLLYPLAYLAANSVISATFAAAAPVLGGLFADFFAAHQLTLALTWTGGAQNVTVPVLNFQSWTF